MDHIETSNGVRVDFYNVMNSIRMLNTTETFHVFTNGCELRLLRETSRVFDDFG